jgi:Kef-type K+ transport system membrane component KefB
MIFAAASQTTLAILLLDLSVIAALALALGALARRVGQAAVIGEILAGLLLGPSLLGLLPGQPEELLFPQAIRPHLQMLADVALVLFMFGIGFEVRVADLRRMGRDALEISAAAVLVPLVAAIGIAPLLWAAQPQHAGVSQVPFVAFFAIAMCATAFPVLARVLADAGLQHSRLGSMALMIAAMTDLVVWLALAALAAAVGAGKTGLPIGWMIAGTVGFVAVVAFVVRPVLRRGLMGSWCRRHGPAGGSLLLLCALALCAAATTLLGLHPAFGAFALGVACPRRCGPSGERGNSVVPAAGALSTAGLLLVPLYFVVTGLKVDVTGLGAQGALEVLALLLAATGAKVGGVAWAASRTGFDRGEAVGLGLLLNTRGLTELIILDIGRSAGVIDEHLFTVLVIVTILATAMTMPLLPYALRLGRRSRRIALRAPALPGG